MKIFIILIFFIFLFLNSSISSQWIWQEVAPHPEKISNCAVTGWSNLVEENAFTFAGIDSTKLASGIHLRSYRYNRLQNSWTQLPNLPDTLGKIAAAASTVKNKIYIIGGYHVSANGNEISSNKVHVFDPQSSMFLPDALNSPIGIDDHVQLVWRDSLIICVAGWSNTGNTTQTNIFDPTLNTWTSSTPIISSNQYRSFGAAGCIIGDTIFYYGGANSSFAATNFIRKGVINPLNPSQITWSSNAGVGNLPAYRPLSFAYENDAYFYGGSNRAYNYDGIPYSGVMPALPHTQLIKFRGNQSTVEIQPIGRMDFRGVAQLLGKSWLLVGGMDSNLNVRKNAYILSNQSLILNEIANDKSISIATYNDFWEFTNKMNNLKNWTLFDLTGNRVSTGSFVDSNRISRIDLKSGLYVLLIDNQSVLKLTN